MEYQNGRPPESPPPRLPPPQTMGQVQALAQPTMPNLTTLPLVYRKNRSYDLQSLDPFG